MSENSRLCLEIIHDLLKEEHHRSPKIFVKNSRINIVQTISFIVEELKQSYSHRNFGFTTSAPAIYINTDEVKLLQVVNNLTSNSIKFTPDDKPIVINVQEQQEYVIVSVEDHGIGIPDQLKPFVFDRKGGAGRTGLNGERSIGMGLSICKNLVQLLRGEMWFESSEGTGSIFYFRLPKE
jgi:two-component system sensor histidine kinase VicK